MTRRADQRYRTGSPTGTGGAAGGTSRRREGSNGQSGTAGGSEDGAGAGSAPPGPRVRPCRAIEDAALSAGQQDALEKIVQALRERYPEVARDLGW